MAETYTDPVCGMQVIADNAAATSTYQGNTYYFCSVADKETFDRNPDKYVRLVDEERQRNKEENQSMKR